jgi:hypothetical protein
MNLRLSDQRIRATYRELKRKHGRVSGRRLCAELRARFGAVGKAERVFRIWREECAPAEVPTAPSLPADMVLLQRRLVVAEAAAAECLKRAELAEFRERAHQDFWAVEIDRLRQELAAVKGGRGQILTV